jgi:hypothetical protein
VRIYIALRGFVPEENIRLVTRFVLYKIKIGHAAAQRRSVRPHIQQIF